MRSAMTAPATHQGATMLEPARARIHTRSGDQLDVVESAIEIERKMSELDGDRSGRRDFRVHTPKGYGRAMQARPRDPRFVRCEDVTKVETLAV
jgi:hypothetical protein